MGFTLLAHTLRKPVWGLLLALSFTATFAVLLPVAVGVNFNVMVQALPPGTAVHESPAGS
jgi:hypothetical protein